MCGLVMGTLKTRAVAVLCAGMSLQPLACIWADAPEMYSCAVVGRAAVVRPDGTVLQETKPLDMARYYRQCDFVATGRFSAVTIADYDMRSPEAVVAVFETEEVLVGAELAYVRVRVAGGMLVQPGETVSRETAGNVYENDELTRMRLHDTIVDDLRQLHRQGAVLTDERLRSLEGMLGRLWLLRTARIDRATEMRFGTDGMFISAGTSFYHEGGAIDPDTLFLLGLDAVRHEGTAHEKLDGINALIHWGDFAAAVADVIRGE